MVSRLRSIRKVQELFHSNMLAWYLERWPQARASLVQPSQDGVKCPVGNGHGEGPVTRALTAHDDSGQAGSVSRVPARLFSLLRGPFA